MKFYLYRKALCLIFAGVSCSAFSQEQSDTLYQKLASAQGIAKFNAMIDIAKFYGYQNFDSSISYALKARSIALECNDTTKIVEVHRRLGVLYNRLSDGVNSEKYLSIALRFSKRHTDERVKVLSELGLSFMHRGRYDVALKYLRESIAFASKDHPYLPHIHSNLGLLYYRIGENRKAIEHYNAAIRCDSTDLENLAIRLSNIGLSYNAIKNFEEAESYFEMAMASCNAITCVDGAWLIIEFGLGICKFDQGCLDEALPFLRSSLVRAKRIGQQRFEAETLLYLARLDLVQGQLTHSFEQLRQAEELALRLNNLEVLKEIYECLSYVKTEMKDFQSASMYQRKWMAVKDSIYSSEVRNRLTAIEVENVEAENQLKIVAKNALLAAKEEIINLQRWMILAFILAALFFIMLLLIAMRHAMKKHKLNNLLRTKVRDRTKTLQDQVSKLEEAKIHQACSTVLLLANLRKDIATLIGLCEVATAEISDVSVSKEVEARLRKISNDLNGNLDLVQELEKVL